MRKICTSCKQEIDTILFGTYVQKKNGRTYINSRCKECAKSISNSDYYHNHEQRKEQGRAYYRIKNLSIVPNAEFFNNKYLRENKTRVCNTCSQEKNIDSFEKGFNRGKIYHRKKCKECDRERNNLKAQRRKKLKLASDPTYKLYHLISNKIRAALNGNKAGKSFKKYLTYTLDELKQHIESQFEPWMTWDNWGVYDCKSWNDNDISTWTWQIDHIIPHSKFKYVSMNDENFKKCWKLNNLRPLSSKHNLEKRNT